MKIELGLDSHPHAKQPFLTAFSKTNMPSIIEELGTWQARLWFRNPQRIFSWFIPGYPRVTPYVPKIT